MTTVDEQKVLREAYSRCLVLKELLHHQTLGDSLATKAEQLADAIHHYIVKKTEYSTVAIGAGQGIKRKTMDKLKINDRIRILIGVYKGKKGRVDMLSANKGIGVLMFAIERDEYITLPLTWFKPEEIEKI